MIWGKQFYCYDVKRWLESLGVDVRRDQQQTVRAATVFAIGEASTEGAWGCR